MERFVIGSTVRKREVLHGQVWMSMPVEVVADDDVLAVWLKSGTPLEFPPHPFGPHPWSDHERWVGSSVLQLHRPGIRYSVWAFFVDESFDRWYINFEEPYKRGEACFDTVDHGLDIVIEDGRWRWKDRDDVAGQVAGGRLTSEEAAEVWGEAERLAAALDRGDCWWLPRWQGWQPPQ
ncbi:DUF402 domain-containing protein [Nocardia sp. 2]|uniref:DUF402 domain-containing protein n=1 Tax=Nocardia acididurans TaxID=2802282 RepID=A0ABS1MFG4_9NOCA|nr:DUF402 domain-containing protein [Nocardia acididurans]MBL1078820.1 DUF402 domain-containing protein [Nocardia acididurans]